MKLDPLAVVEASYRFDRPDDVWLRGILEATRPALDHGLGILAFCYDVSLPASARVGALAADKLPAEFMRQVAEGAVRADLGRAKSAFLTHVVSSASEADASGEIHSWFAEQVRPLGIADAVFINAVDPTGIGCLVSAAVPRVTGIPRGLRATWSRVAAHMAAGHRLRRRLGAEGPLPRDLARQAEAVLSPSGKMEHAEDPAKAGPARATLREAVLARERARGPLRRSAPEIALAEWKGLVAARWSLMDVFENDGKRYLVARCNEADAGGLEALSPRERQAVGFASLGHSNKLIAYELGLAPSTIGVLLWRAARKLGARSREELILVFLRSRTERRES